MKVRARGYRLPDGTTTTSVAKHHLAWRGLADTLEKAFPGLRLLGFNPNFMFDWNNRPIDLPTDFVQQLVKILEGTK